jgi:hypothetical protein
MPTHCDHIYIHNNHQEKITIFTRVGPIFFFVEFDGDFTVLCLEKADFRVNLPQDDRHCFQIENLVINQHNILAFAVRARADFKGVYCGFRVAADFLCPVA